jgi:hypothetical protein
MRRGPLHVPDADRFTLRKWLAGPARPEFPADRAFEGKLRISHRQEDDEPGEKDADDEAGNVAASHVEEEGHAHVTILSQRRSPRENLRMLATALVDHPSRAA